MTLRLLDFAQHNWRRMNGEALTSGQRLIEFELEDFCDFVWWNAVKEADEKGKARFEQWLWMPPVGVRATSGPWSPEAETGAFNALKNLVGK